MKRAGWQLAPWGALRLAGLPAAQLTHMRLARSARLERALSAEESAMSARREALAAELFSGIHGCNDRALRQGMLRLKRDLHNGRQTAWALSESALGGLASALRTALAAVLTAEARLDSLRAEYEAAVLAEWQESVALLRGLMPSPPLLSGLELSSSDLYATAVALAALPPGAPLTSQQRKGEIAIANYLLRAMTRTTPFSGFAGVALIPLADSRAEATDTQVWRSFAQVNVGRLAGWLARNLSPTARQQLVLQPVPVRAVSDGAAPSVSFVRIEPDTAGETVTETWLNMALTPAIRTVLASGEGLPAAELALRLSASGQAEALNYLEQLTDVGFLHRLFPRPEPDAAGLERLAGSVAGLGDPHTARRLCEMAATVSRYGDAPPTECAVLLRNLDAELGPGRGSPLYEDVLVEGLGLEAVGITPERLLEDLLPALMLARSTLTDAPHRQVVRAFVARFGPDGECHDVPTFLASLLGDEAFMVRLRAPDPSLPWAESAIGRAAATASGFPAELAPAWFAALPAPDGPCAVSLFVQVAARDRSAAARGEYTLVLNGMQSGRSKYLSRYLTCDTPSARNALAAARRKLASEEPLPVEVAPVLGLNFQVHPLLTQWCLELPGEPGPGADRTLPLSDLHLRFDARSAQLRLRSARLGRDVEPVHLGFLRSALLPPPLLLLLALSPGLRDDTFAERAALYRLLDQADLMRGAPLQFHRPRLQVGRLVLERARWALPAADLPVQALRESHAAYFRRIRAWLTERGLPDRGFVRVFANATGFTTPMYVDWQNPLTLAGLPHLLGTRRQEGEEGRWLLLTELLPEPESSLLRLEGLPHAFELLVQADWRDRHV